MFKEFFELFPHKFLNMTNGVTPRRWLYSCNPGLSQLISTTIGNEDDWVTDMRMVTELVASAEDPHFVQEFLRVKADCKR